MEIAMSAETLLITCELHRIVAQSPPGDTGIGYIGRRAVRWVGGWGVIEGRLELGLSPSETVVCLCTIEVASDQTLGSAATLSRTFIALGVC
jgi:hypothetical protein